MPDTVEIIRILEEIAYQDCTCTFEQQSGQDSTVCESCQAASSLNNIHKQAQEVWEYFTR